MQHTTIHWWLQNSTIILLLIVTNGRIVCMYTVVSELVGTLVMVL